MTRHHMQHTKVTMLGEETCLLALRGLMVVCGRDVLDSRGWMGGEGVRWRGGMALEGLDRGREGRCWKVEGGLGV